MNMARRKGTLVTAEPELGLRQLRIPFEWLVTM